MQEEKRARVCEVSLCSLNDNLSIISAYLLVTSWKSWLCWRQTCSLLNDVAVQNTVFVRALTEAKSRQTEFYSSLLDLVLGQLLYLHWNPKTILEIFRGLSVNDFKPLLQQVIPHCTTTALHPQGSTWLVNTLKSYMTANWWMVKDTTFYVCSTLQLSQISIILLVKLRYMWHYSTLSNVLCLENTPVFERLHTLRNLNGDIFCLENDVKYMLRTKVSQPDFYERYTIKDEARLRSLTRKYDKKCAALTAELLTQLKANIWPTVFREKGTMPCFKVYKLASDELAQSNLVLSEFKEYFLNKAKLSTDEQSWVGYSELAKDSDLNFTEHLQKVHTDSTKFHTCYNKYSKTSQ